jgi:hypothetical protein
MDFLQVCLLKLLSSKDPQISNYCAKTIADMMRRDYSDEEISVIICYINTLTKTSIL